MKNTGESAVHRVVVATGISSVVTQLLIIRECLAQFQGNEYVIALILFNWLTLGGIGTMATRVVYRSRWRATRSRLAGLSMALGGLSAAQILAIRFLRDAFFLHGASVGFYPTLTFTFLTMAPYGLLVGFALPYSLFVLRSERPETPGTRIYIMDNIGDVMGGALFAFLLVHLSTPFQSLFVTGMPLVISAWFLLSRTARRRLMPNVGAIASLAVLIAGMALEPVSLAPVEGELALYKESRYGRVTVTQNREQYTVFEDGVPVRSTQDPVAAEEAIHYSGAQLENPQRGLLISAGSGMMEELEKYRFRAVDYVELNPEVTRAQFRFGLIRKIPGLRVIHRDGRAFLAESNTLYDVIWVNLPEPQTFQTNRFFTDGFFALARDRLRNGGVLQFSVKGFDNYLAEPQRQKISALYNTVERFFPHVLMLPGEKIHFLCSNRPLSADIPGLLAEKKIETAYIRHYYDGNVTVERIRQLRDLLNPAAPRNTDPSPRLMQIMFTQWFAKFSTSPTAFIVVVGALGLVYLIRLGRAEFVLFSTGFMTMGSEILVIFAFQIFFGYVYMQIGLIITVFLAGLLPGAWFGYRLAKSGKRVLVTTDIVLILLICVFIAAAGRSADPVPSAFFLCFGFGVSLVCGCQFPVALGLRGDLDEAAAGAFSADLTGAAFGTLVTSVVLLPFVGIIWTAVFLIALKFFSLVAMGTYREADQQA